MEVSTPPQTPLSCSTSTCSSHMITSPFENSPTLLLLTPTLVLPCPSMASPASKDKKPPKSQPGRSRRLALGGEHFVDTPWASAKLLLLREAENHPSGPVACRPKIASTPCPSPGRGPELPGGGQGAAGEQDARLTLLSAAGYSLHPPRHLKEARKGEKAGRR